MFSQAVVLLAFVAVVMSKVCPPSCNPPASITGCVRFRRASKCTQEKIAVSTEELVCGCMWQKYILTVEPQPDIILKIYVNVFTVLAVSTEESVCGCMWREYILTVEPQANVIFTDGGEECYTWAIIKCSEDERAKSTVVAAAEIQQSILEGINKLRDVIQDQSLIIMDPGSPVAKHRKRGGVKFEIDQAKDGNSGVSAVGRKLPVSEGPPEHYSYIGKLHRNGELSWVDVSPVMEAKEALAEAQNDSDSKAKASWLLKLEDEEFKLWVFLVILMMNVVVVLMAIFCRSDQKSEPKEVRPMGDLDPDMYIQNKAELKTNSIGNFFEKLRTYKERKGRQKSHYTQLEDGQAWAPIRRGSNSSQADETYQSLRRPSGGLYDDLENTYEEPVFDTRRPSFQMPQGRAGYSGSDPTDDQRRQVAFTVPSTGQNKQTNALDRKKPGRSKGPPIFSLGKFLD